MKLLVLCLLTAACAVTRVPPDTTTVASLRRARVLERDLAWIADSVPIVRFNPPFIYGAWRMEVEACSGRTREGWPRFYVAPIAPIGADGRVAFYAHDSNVIVFALGHEGVAWVYRHEMLHFLLNGEYGPDDPHPAEYFAVRCGSLVNPVPR